jgi:hypothetical protein
MWRFAYWYLHLALFFGFYSHVCKCTNKWALQGGGWNEIPWKKISALKRTAFKMRSYLFSNNYPHCPSCFWPVLSPNEHIEDQTSWCYERTLPRCAICGRLTRSGNRLCGLCFTDQEIEKERIAAEIEEARREELALAQAEEEFRTNQLELESQCPRCSEKLLLYQGRWICPECDEHIFN